MIFGDVTCKPRIIFGKDLTREKVTFREETRLEGNENGQTLRLPYPFKDILIFIVFNLYLAVTINCLRCEPWVVLSCQQFVSRHYLIQIRLFMIGLPLGNGKHELRTKNIFHILPSHNDHVSTTCPFRFNCRAIKFEYLFITSSKLEALKGRMSKS